MRRSKSVARSQPKASFEQEIAQMRDLDLNGLRACWRSVTGREALPHLSRHLLFAMLAYRIQAEALGDLDAETLRFLKKLGTSGSDDDAGPLTDAFNQRRRSLLQGTVLTREWNGQTHRVMVVSDGFAWNGRTYKSLSTIAYAITGTKWNGPRFFALRDRKAVEVQP
jgi:hypothetical protein